MVDYMQVQMDLGVMVCSWVKLVCVICLLQDVCVVWCEGCIVELFMFKFSKILFECEVVVLLLCDVQQCVLLQKWLDIGIWVQLWMLLQVEVGSDLQDWFDVYVDGLFEDVEELLVLQYIFSYYRLYLQVLLWKVCGLCVEEFMLCWVVSDELFVLGLLVLICKLFDGVMIKMLK